MTYPFSTHSRVKRREMVHITPLKAVSLSSLATNTTYIVNVPPGYYNVSLAVFKSDNSDGAINMKFKPFVDDGQTTVNSALFAYEMGSSTVASALDVASSNTNLGHIWEFIADAGSGGNKLGGSQAIHSHAGYQLTVDTNTNATTGASLGKLTVEIHAETQ